MFEDEADKDMLEDMACNHIDSEDEDSNSEGTEESDMNNWIYMFDDAQHDVYLGCSKFSLLSAVIQVLNLKVDGQ